MTFRLAGLLVASLAWAGRGEDPLAATPVTSNINSRYTVEAVDLAPKELSRLPRPLRERLAALIGLKFDPALMDDLRKKIQHELAGRLVTMKLERGSSPDQVRVVLEVGRGPDGLDFDLDVPRLLYHSKHNFTFGLNAKIGIGHHAVRFGALTDNDELVERFSGIQGGYEWKQLAGGRVALRVDAASWRSQWNPAVPAALASRSDLALHRARAEVEPGAVIRILEPLTLQLGVSFGRLDLQDPAARDELSSAALTALRFQRRWELASGRKHELDASYGLRAATRALAGDYVFTRHAWRAHWSYSGAPHALDLTFHAGALNGRAPLAERFILGNSRSLRGWSRFEIAPFGADRIAHGSVDYRWRRLRLIYDTGAAWLGRLDARDQGTLRHSLAAGLAEGSFSFLVAFPLREGRAAPIFLLGMSF